MLSIRPIPSQRYKLRLPLSNPHRVLYLYALVFLCIYLCKDRLVETNRQDRKAKKGKEINHTLFLSLSSDPLVPVPSGSIIKYTRWDQIMLLYVCYLGSLGTCIKTGLDDNSARHAPTKTIPPQTNDPSQFLITN